MFVNLIESDSHSAEYKRRGAFFAGTLLAYAILIGAGGAASVAAYEATVDTQLIEWISLVAPAEPESRRDTERPRPATPRAQTSGSIARRTSEPPSDDRTRIDPGVRTSTNQPPPLKPGKPWEYDIVNSDPDPVERTMRTNGRETRGTGNDTPDTETPPPPPPSSVPVKRTPQVLKTSEVLNGQALHLPKPVYTRLALIANAVGKVTVQILIDETGRVISAKAVTGHPLLLLESERAALRARFTPTLLNGEPVKVSGLIIYNFTKN